MALSTTKAEYMAVTEAIKEALWLKGLFGEFNLHQGVTVIYYDSQSAIHLTKDQMYHERTKHIKIKYHFIRDIIGEGKVLVRKINTKENPADMFTKSLPVYKFKQCLDLVGDLGPLGLIWRRWSKFIITRFWGLIKVEIC